MSWEFAIILFVFGVLLVILELCLPSFGLLTVGAIVCFAFSIWGMYYSEGPVAGAIMAVLAPVVALSVIYFGLKYVPRSSWGRGLVLREPKDAGAPAAPPVSETARLSPEGATVEKEMSPLLGKEGVAQSELRPAGIAIIAGKRVDVVTEGTLVHAGARVRVIVVEGNRVIVRRVQV